MKTAFLVVFSQGEPGSYPERVFLSRQRAESFANEKNAASADNFGHFVEDIELDDEEDTSREIGTLSNVTPGATEEGR